MSESQSYQRRPVSAHHDGTVEEQGVIARAELTALGYDVDVPAAREDDGTPDSEES